MAARAYWKGYLKLSLVTCPEKEERSNVLDLMEALRRSVKGGGGRAAALRSRGDTRKTSKPRAPSRRRRRKAA